MNWVELKNIEQVNELIEQSTNTAILFFKHSTRCSISIVALGRLERNWDLDEKKVIPVYLDLLQYRTVSNYLATVFNVEHQSPQVILIKDKKVIYHDSHSMIDVDSIKEKL